MSKARIVARKMAGRNHAVNTIEGSNGDYCRQPCEECPWKIANTGSFPAEAFRISASTAYDMSFKTFGCHMSKAEKPATCAGFILQAGDDNLSVRIRRSKGAMLDVTDGGQKLHQSYKAMAVANGVRPNDPVLEPCMPEARSNYERETHDRNRSRRTNRQPKRNHSR